MRTLVGLLSMGTVVAAVSFGSLPAAAHKPNKCPAQLKHRTPAEVLADHRAALAAKDWHAVGCNYAKDAIVISDMGVTQGRENIVADLQGFDQAFGGALPTVTMETVADDTALVLFELDLGFLLIPDGVDTYIIRKGKIFRQTAHGQVVFTGPPPPPPAP